MWPNVNPDASGEGESAHSPARILLGNGGHARVVLDALREAGHDVAAIVAPTFCDVADFSGIFRFEDNGDFRARYARDECLLVCGIGSVPGARSRSRREVCDRFEEWGYNFDVLRHPSAIISSRAELAPGVQILPGAVLQAGSTIGSHTIINTRASVDHDCLIGRHVHVAPGATLCGGVIVGDGAFIGSGAILTQGIVVPPGRLIPAGTCVSDPILGA